MKTQLLPQQPNRIETGPIQFGDDWPGVFIRGDYAGPMALVLMHAIDSGKVDGFNKPMLEGLKDTLASCVLGPSGDFLRGTKPVPATGAAEEGR